jgi:hypothetical protein
MFAFPPSFLIIGHNVSEWPPQVRCLRRKQVADIQNTILLGSYQLFLDHDQAILSRNYLEGNLETISIVASSLSMSRPQKTETLAGEDRLFLSASELIVISLFKFRYNEYLCFILLHFSRHLYHLPSTGYSTLLSFGRSRCDCIGHASIAAEDVL